MLPASAQPVTGIALTFALFAGCVTVPSSQGSDGLLHTIDCAGSPTCHQQPSTVGVRLRGHIVVEGPVSEQPVTFTKVNLVHKTRTVDSASSDQTGAFEFARAIDDGVYELVLESDRYEGQKRVEIDGASKDALIVAKARVAAPQ
jgi:hypothetical protein